MKNAQWIHTYTNVNQRVGETYQGEIDSTEHVYRTWYLVDGDGMILGIKHDWDNLPVGDY